MAVGIGFLFADWTSVWQGPIGYTRLDPPDTLLSAGLSAGASASEVKKTLSPRLPNLFTICLSTNPAYPAEKPASFRRMVAKGAKTSIPVPCII